MNNKDFTKNLRKKLRHDVDQFHQVLESLEEVLRELEQDFFRVCIFGSARIGPKDQTYRLVEQLSFELAKRGIDVVTGGGPGLMEAANKGAQRGRAAGHSKSRSIGVTIDLPFDEPVNQHMDIKRMHRRFSSRLDDFMRVSHVVVVTAGGIGTLLELYYTWQLLQVGHVEKRPVLLVGRKMWGGLLDWMKKEQLSRGLISERDLKMVQSVDKVGEILKVVEATRRAYVQKRKGN